MNKLNDAVTTTTTLTTTTTTTTTVTDMNMNMNNTSEIANITSNEINDILIQNACVNVNDEDVCRPPFESVHFDGNPLFDYTFV